MCLGYLLINKAFTQALMDGLKWRKGYIVNMMLMMATTAHVYFNHCAKSIIIMTALLLVSIHNGNKDVQRLSKCALDSRYKSRYDWCYMPLITITCCHSNEEIREIIFILQLSYINGNFLRNSLPDAFPPTGIEHSYLFLYSYLVFLKTTQWWMWHWSYWLGEEIERKQYD